MIGCRIFIITVPTPIDDVNQPDLTSIIKASETVAKSLKVGDVVVVYESTNISHSWLKGFCVPILEEYHSLILIRDFFCVSSPRGKNYSR